LEPCLSNTEEIKAKRRPAVRLSWIPAMKHCADSGRRQEGARNANVGPYGPPESEQKQKAAMKNA